MMTTRISRPSGQIAKADKPLRKRLGPFKVFRLEATSEISWGFDTIFLRYDVGAEGAHSADQKSYAARRRKRYRQTKVRARC